MKKNSPKAPAGRLANKIKAAQSGDTTVARELISMASLQLKERCKLEPDLMHYLIERLEAVYLATPDQLGLALLLYKKKPANRPHDERRIQSAKRWAAAARELLIIDDDEDANTALEGFNESREMKGNAAIEKLRLTYSDLDQSRRPPTQAEVWRLAARLFNHQLECDQKERGERLKEKQMTPESIRMTVTRPERKKT